MQISVFIAILHSWFWPAGTILLRYIALIISLLATLSLFAQVDKIDSLRQRVQTESDPLKKIELLNALSFQHFNENLKEANQSTQSALELAVHTNQPVLHGWTLAYRGVYYFLSGLLQDAVPYLQESLSIGEKSASNNLHVYSLTMLGNIYRDKGSYDSALQFYRKAEINSSQQQKGYYFSVLKMNLARFYLMKKMPDEGLREAQEALVVRQSLSNSLHIAHANVLVGNCFMADDNLTEAESYYQQVLPYLSNDLQLKADYLQSMGDIYFRRGDFKLALEKWSEVLQNYRKHQYKYALANLMLRMGTAFEEQGYFELSQEYLSDALRISEQAGFKAIIAEIFHQQSWIYYRTKNFDLALSTSAKAEQLFSYLHTDVDVARCWDLQGLAQRNLGNYKESLSLHLKSLESRKKNGGKVELSAGLFNTGEFYLFTKAFKKALPYYYQSLSIDKTLGDNYGISLNYNRIGEIFTQLSIFDSAKFYLEKSLALSIPISSNEVYRENFLDIAALYEKQGMFAQAIPLYKKYNLLRDSISSSQTAQSLASYKILYDVERNEQQLQLIQKDNQLAKSTLLRQRFLLYALVIGLSLFILLAFMYYRFNKSLRRLNLSLAERNEEIQAQSEELTESNEMLSNLNREIAEQKEEIQAQAEELTESNQAISSINNLLEERVEQRTAELKQAFKELDTFFYRSSHDFRRPLTTFMGLAEVARVLVKEPLALELFERVNENAHNLDKMLRKLQSISDVGTHENIYKEVSLKDLIEIEVKKLNEELTRKNIKVTFQSHLEKPFYSYATLLSIVIHNLLENAIAFSKEKDAKIAVTVYQMEQEVVLEVKDNGVGIEQEYHEKVFEMYFRGNENSKGNGLGLYIVKKSVQKLNGRIELKSSVAVETVIRILLPYRLT